MTEKAKRINNSKKKKEYANKHGTIIVSEAMGKPVPDYFLEKLGEELVEFVEDENVLTLTEFLIHRKIDSHFFYECVRRNDTLKKHYNMAKMILACRRERGAITRKYDAGSALRMMPHYDEDWANMMRFEAELKKQSQGEAANVNIVIEELKIPNSPLVPPLKDKDD